MTRRNKLFLYLGIGILLLLLLLLLLYFLNRSQDGGVTPTNQQPTTEPRRLPVIPSPEATTVDVVAGQPEVQASLRTISQTFAERFGSYSNQQGFDYIDDINPLMTTKMRASAKSSLATWLLPYQNSDTYYGVSTEALSVVITEYDTASGRATASVSTQFQESIGTTINPRISYRTMIIQLVNTGSGWQVDEAAWQE